MRGRWRIIPAFLLALFILLSFIQPVIASEETEDEFQDRLSGLLEESNNSITVFYSNSCSACKKVVPEIIELAKEYPEISFNYFDLYGSDENRTIMLAFGEKYGVEYPAYPVVFTGDCTVLEGKSKIELYLRKVLEAHKNGYIPDAEYESSLWSAQSPPSEASNGTATDDNRKISLLLVILSGLADGINPCALSVLALLLATLAGMNSRKKILLGGLVYTFAVFLFYIMAGLGILTIINYSGFSGIFSIAAGIVALIAGIITLTGGIWEGKTVSPGIPVSKRPAIKKIMERASIPAAFVLGMMVGLFELPCTGGIYIAILGLLSSRMTFYEGLPYLLVYNLMFVVPLIAIILAVAFGLSPEKVDSWRDSNKKLLKIGIGLILIAMGLYILAGYLF
ncbi:cytochrome c biogenesis protein transmembrane region [Methanolacinia petrolearia DSM 11571]|uniref:Cytochrome c biogenesis protein transmembrane region n=1 Tax=Methanolacinia petrolearia (strain DSM 11571 / OCM 486 / SEBR 4847) TaxID=679926 RepID=E1RJ29_METP4|nr:cytochrome c biogenesis protein CcdA [Methanolacinia petrolearia]ADN36699.1 cytochrome c biogenesis protein transmembrane region [Methanolacinia petrolearia DSM 11571]